MVGLSSFDEGLRREGLQFAWSDLLKSLGLLARLAAVVAREAGPQRTGWREWNPQPKHLMTR